VGFIVEYQSFAYFIMNSSLPQRQGEEKETGRNGDQYLLCKLEEIYGSREMQ